MGYLFCIIIFLINFVAYSQEKIPQLSLEDISDAIIARNEVIEGNSLWGYINGGADLYFEYGFVAVRVQEITKRKVHIKIDIYQMKSEEAAFGIFSISKRKCLTNDSIAPFQCITPHQIQIVKGQYYITIVNDKATSIEQKLSLEVASSLIKKFENGSISFPLVFQNKVLQPYLNDIKFIRGKLGFQNGFPEWSDLFDSVRIISAYVLPAERENGRVNIALFDFTTEGDAKIFCDKIHLPLTKGKSLLKKYFGNEFRAVKKLTTTELIYFETELNKDQYEPFLNIIEHQE